MRSKLSMDRRRLLIVGGLLAAVTPWAVSEAIRGNESTYSVVPGSDGLALRDGKILVEYFQNIGCAHCRRITPIFSEWASRQLPDITIEHHHIGTANEAWYALSVMHYAMAGLPGAKEAEARIRQQVEDGGVDEVLRGQYGSDWLSAQFPGVGDMAERVERARVLVSATDELAQRMAVESVPTIIIGRQLVAKGRSYEERMEIVENLVHKARGAVLNA